MVEQYLSQMRFDKAVKVILRHEGKFANNLHDKGGATNYGISLRYLRMEGMDLNGDNVIDIEDVLALNPDKARKIYKTRFWDRYHYEAINSLDVAIRIFDMCVHMGALQAHKLAQRACNAMLPPYLLLPLVEDGILGPKTMGVINAIINENKSKELVGEMRDLTIKFYINISNLNPKLKENLSGWFLRVMD